MSPEKSQVLLIYAALEESRKDILALPFMDLAELGINLNEEYEAGTGRNKLARFFREKNIFKRRTKPYQYYIDQGLVVMVDAPQNGIPFKKPVFTVAGYLWLKEKGYIDDIKKVG